MQSHLVIRTFYQYFIKKLFNFFTLKFIISISIIFFLISNLASASNSTLKEVYCDSSKFAILENEINSISSKDKNFNKILGEIDPSLLNKNYNLIVSLGSRPSGGYKLNFDKLKNKNKNTYIYFKEIKPPKNSINIAVITYPFCLLKIENLNNYKIKIKKQRLKFFLLSIFN